MKYVGNFIIVTIIVTVKQNVTKKVTILLMKAIKKSDERK